MAGPAVTYKPETSYCLPSLAQFENLKAQKGSLAFTPKKNAGKKMKLTQRSNVRMLNHNMEMSLWRKHQNF
jgi:hypothetical protein